VRQFNEAIESSVFVSMVSVFWGVSISMWSGVTDLDLALGLELRGRGVGLAYVTGC